MKKKVVIAEDDPALLDALQLVFKRAGFEVSGYPNGSVLMNSALDIPDIFLIDRQLSGIDGLDICRYLKKNGATRHVPVIILSASPGIGALVKNAGAEAFVEKPFSNKVLIALVQQLLQ